MQRLQQMTDIDILFFANKPNQTESTQSHGIKCGAILTILLYNFSKTAKILTFNAYNAYNAPKARKAGKAYSSQHSHSSHHSYRSDGADRSLYIFYISYIVLHVSIKMAPRKTRNNDDVSISKKYCGDQMGKHLYNYIRYFIFILC